ncbi:flavin reductase family protein [Methylomonas sp. EFPC1]|uniref:Flavin reductase family protein n=1 Tax=Methylomonas defluvii TaxID=3045149 RepID=A0ABU4UA65_9GAMM|nr:MULTISPECIES: flavin reductase family protein [unclassified Methylomonas]MDX8126317.1 flavin reductase family protein [Methylomonas sp. OY6]QSB02796.1 flavin reductase family protein [Methylomonas sp. EFPC1]
MSVEAKEFKNALKLWASGVTVVTTQGRDNQPRGMTATAFSSVSVEPPQILVCLNQATDTGAALLESRRFAVNILNSAQEDVSNQFAGSTTQEQRFASIAWQAGENGAPILSEALAALECRVVQQVQAGSHWVIIGEVDSVVCREGEPLLYYHSAYRTVAAQD